MAGCYPLTPDEETELTRFPPLECSVFEDDPYDIYEVGSECIHLYSARLREAVEKQGLSHDMRFVEAHIFARTDNARPALFYAVRYEPPLCIPCLRPLPIYRAIDFGGGDKIYKRRGSLLILDKGKINPSVRLFCVSNVVKRPLVVREDVLLQWLEWGIKVDFQEVLFD